jgi:hypothetical protein
MQPAGILSSFSKVIEVASATSQLLGIADSPVPQQEKRFCFTLDFSVLNFRLPKFLAHSLFEDRLVSWHISTFKVTAVMQL